MWGFTLVTLLLRIFYVFGKNITEFSQEENQTVPMINPKTDFKNVSEELKVAEFGSFLDDMVDWASSASDYIREKSRSEIATLQSTEDGRRLIYKKAEFRFLTKTLLILKIFVSLMLPLGIISSKILSWKAVTLSLMAFMLAKILFIKNLFMGKNAFPVTPTNFLPPVLIHGGTNDVFWKRQGEAQNAYSWSST